jgi:hypothetical protein
MPVHVRLIDSLRHVVRTLSPSCRHASRLQSEALDRPLSRWERLGLSIHLMLCRMCRRYGRQLRVLQEVSQAQARQQPGLDEKSLQPSSRERMKAALRNGSA